MLPKDRRRDGGRHFQERMVSLAGRRDGTTVHAKHGMNPETSRAIWIVLVVASSALAAWAFSDWLESRRRHLFWWQRQDALSRWENEGGHAGTAADGIREES